MADASHRVIPLITRTNKPSVRMMKGQDNSFRNGRTTAFTRPNITAMAANVVTPSRSTRTPGTSQAATTSETEVMIQRTSNFIFRRTLPADLNPDTIGIAERDGVLVPRHLRGHTKILQLARYSGAIETGDSH